jgi:hypothetical protein
VDEFWKIWKNEYLLSLRERYQNKLKLKRVESTFKPKAGDVVLIKDDLPRGSWRLGKIVNLETSRDGCVRSAKLLTSSGRILGRPLCLLYPLEVSDRDEETSTKDKEQLKKREIPSRVAAEKARESIKTQL